MSDEEKKERGPETEVKPLEDEDSAEYTARIYREGLAKFDASCKCGGQGCIACMI